MRRKSVREELQFDAEGDTFLEEVTLIEDDHEDLDLQQPFDIEDFLYETWKESQIHNQDDTKSNIGHAARE